MNHLFQNWCYYLLKISLQTGFKIKMHSTNTQRVNLSCFSLPPLIKRSEAYREAKEIIFMPENLLLYL